MPRRVLVVGDNDLAGLTAVRSLGRAGRFVELVAFEPNGLARRSRYARRVHDLGHPQRDPAGFAGRLLDLLERRPFDLVLPTSDKGLLPLLGRRDEVEAFAPLAAPDNLAFGVAHRKDLTADLARRCGVPVPPTEVLYHARDLKRWRPPAAYPVVLKPASSELPGASRRNEVAVVRSADELDRVLPPMLSRCAVLVQGFCPGRGVGLNVLAKAGEVLAAFQHERVHEPPRGGASSYRKSVPLSPELLGHARRMCAEMGWTGPAMFEFKADRDAAVLMEVNGRLWGSVSLAVGAGVDFPVLMDDLFAGRPVGPVFDYRVPYYCRHTTRDVFWLRENLRTPAGRPDLLRLSAREVAAEAWHVLRGREGYDLESATDPLPAVAAWCRFAGGIVSGLARRLRQRRLLGFAASQAARLRAGRLPLAGPVLFVCTGNVNRSAFGEWKLRQLGVPASSAGTLDRPGTPSGPVSRTAAAAYGVDLTRHRSQTLTREMLRAAGVVVAMDVTHLEAVARLDRSALAKTVLPGALRPAGVDAEIPDPDGQDEATFRETYRAVGECVAGLAEWLGRRGGRLRAG